MANNKALRYIAGELYALDPKTFLILTAAGIINAFGVTLFLFPVKLFDSGISGLTIRFGGAIDGIDVLSVVFAKKLGISIGSFVMIFNTILYTVCGITIKSWILPLYSIVTYYIGSRTVDFVVEGIDRAKYAMIVTTKAGEISDAIAEHFQSSGTIVQAVGGYSKEHKEIIYYIVNRFQINRLKRLVLSIDPNAFMSLQDVSDIIKKQG